jgi:hypothetical protein
MKPTPIKIEIRRDEDGDLPDFKVGTLLKTKCHIRPVAKCLILLVM